MPLLDITLKCPEEIARAVAEGRYHLFGSVVRDNTGRVITMLETVMRQSTRAARRNPKIAIAAFAVAGAAGAAVFFGSRLTRKARCTSRQLAKLYRTIEATLTEHPSELTRDDLKYIRAGIDEFLRFTEDHEYGDVTLDVTEDARRTLNTFVEALRSFSDHLKTLGHRTERVPELELSPDTKLVPLLNAIRTQLDYQERNWPSA